MMRILASSRWRGFSLLEMMAVVAVLGIMAALSVPDLAPVVHEARLRGAADELANFIERARREAKASGRCILIRPEGVDLVMQRRATVDCVNDTGDADWSAPFAALKPQAAMSFEMTGLPSATTPFVIRPSGRVRGDGDLDVTDDGALFRLLYTPAAPTRFDVVVTPIGRICATRTNAPAAAPVPPLTCAAVAFANAADTPGGTPGAGSNIYPPTSPAAASTPGSFPGGSCGGAGFDGACGGGGAPLPSGGGGTPVGTGTESTGTSSCGGSCGGGTGSGGCGGTGDSGTSTGTGTGLDPGFGACGSGGCSGA